MKPIFSPTKLLWIWAVISVMSGCISPSPTLFPTATQPSKELATPFPTRSYSPTDMPLLVIPQLTAKPTLAITIAPTLSLPTPTMTPDIILTAQENPPTITELLMTNLGCKLPCWWGIMPGQTAWAETKQFLIRLGARIGSSPQSDGSIYHGTGGFDILGRDKNDNFVTIHNVLGFTEKNTIVEDIYLRSIGDSNPVGFQSALESYSPRNVMADYGAPTRVWMYTDSMDYGDRTGYSLWLAYDNLGFLIRYEGFVQQRDKPIYRICPRFDHGMDIQEIVIVLQSPDNPRHVEEMDPYYPHVMQYIHSLEDATGLTVEEFYQLFTQDKKPACFDTPKNIWPSSFP
jgi:hypothetical protein